jgi:hypothetical protein
VLLFGFAKNSPTTWHAEAWKDIEANMDVRQGDSEHVIEAQTIAGFPDGYLSKHGLPDTCNVISDYLKKKELKIDAKKGLDQGTISELIAAVFPSKENYKNEFILFDNAPNSKIKMRVGFTYSWAYVLH